MEENKSKNRGCIKFLILPSVYQLWWGRISRILWREQGKTMAMGKNTKWKKRKGGAISSIILRLLERILSGEEGMGRNILGNTSISKKGFGMQIKFSGTLYTSGYKWGKCKAKGRSNPNLGCRNGIKIYQAVKLKVQPSPSHGKHWDQKELFQHKSGRPLECTSRECESSKLANNVQE